MNTTDLERYLREMARIGEQNAPLGKAFIEVELFIVEHWIPFTLLALVWYGLHIHATWTNLRDNAGVDRLTWLFAIWLPFGLIFYWRLGIRGSAGSFGSPGNSGQPPANLPSERDTASAITAALAEDSRKRRQQSP